MKYSVIIPAYNTADTLKDTVDSIQKSGITDYEILIIDDGSVDETPAICDHLAQTCEQLSCFHQPNSGVSVARNLGIELAKGDYIWFFDSDDRVAPGSLTTIDQTINSQSPDMILFGMSIDFFYKGELYSTRKRVCNYEGIYVSDQIQDIILDLFDSNYLTPVWNKFVRKNLIEDNAIHFSETMHLMEDSLFSMQCLSHCKSIQLVPQAIYQYRQTTVELKGYKRVASIPSLTEYMQHFRGLPADYDSLINKIYYMLLQIAVDKANMKHLKMLAEDHERWMIKPETVSQIELDRKLKRRKLLHIRIHMLIIQIRHKLAVIAKSKGWYKER